MNTACLTQYVNPFIGVDGAGNTLCGPYLPFSMVRLGPDTVRPHKTNGYNSNLPILRFSHTHVSGTGGASRYGNIGIVPFTGVPRLNVGPYERDGETAEPGYYRCGLQPQGILAELTSTARTGVHRYTFPVDGPMGLLVDAGACIQRDFRAAARSTGGFVEWVSATELVGRADCKGGWGHDFPYTVYFYARFDREPHRRLVANGQQGIVPGLAADGPNSQAVAAFNQGGELGLKVGISFVSVGKARAAVARECAEHSFDEVRAAATQTWERMLARIRVEGGTDVDKTVFYTFMTRLTCLPADLGIDDENPLWVSGVRHFSDFYCLWDSVRNANSLIGLFAPEMETAFLNCLLDVAEHNGWLPDAWIAGHSAQVQGGSSADILFCEAKLKGLTGIDYEKALLYMRRNNEVESPDPFLYGRHLPHYREHGYVPTGVINCVSRHLEYSYQDWCIGRLAAELGQPDVAASYLESSRKLWNLWHPELEVFAPKTRDGSWAAPFNPDKTERPDSWNDPYFYEGPSKFWSFNTQHDFAGLLARRGGAEAFAAKLEKLLEAGHTFTKETFMHVPYLFIYAGRPDLTQRWVRDILRREYSTERNGLPDNEDMGCHSAFFMCSAMGLYPIMGQDLYLLTTPLFERTELQMGENGNTVVVEAPGVSDERCYIVSATLNGRPLDRAWVRHAELADGAVLRMEPGPEPSGWGGSQPPPSPLQQENPFA